MNVVAFELGGTTLGRFFKFSFFISLMLLLTIVLTACWEENNKPSQEERALNNPDSTQEFVELTWYYPIRKLQKDQQAVEAAANEITKKKLNTIVHLKPISVSEYEAEMNAIVDSGGKFDIAWTSAWFFNYQNNVMRSAFLPIDELLGQYGKDIKAQIPEFMWTDATINGKIYFIPNYQVVVQRNGFIFLKELVEKYNFDVTKVKSFEDVEPFLETIKNNEKDFDVFSIGEDGFFDPDTYGYWGDAPGLGVSNLGMGLIKKGDDTHTFLEGDLPEFQDYLNLVTKWYLKGYIPQDNLTKGNIKSGGGKAAAVSWGWTLKPGGEIEEKMINGGYDVIYVPLSKPLYTGVTNTMNAISATSEHPDRALMLLNLVNSDPELFNLLSFGIEGKHYTLVDENAIRINTDGGYAPYQAWIFGNVFNGYLLEGQAPDTWEVTKILNETAEFWPYLGFVFNPNPVKTEIENTTRVSQMYMPQLLTGAADPAQTYPEYEREMKEAGMERIIQESQKQLNEWLDNKGTK